MNPLEKAALVAELGLYNTMFLPIQHWHCVNLLLKITWLGVEWNLEVLRKSALSEKLLKLLL
jgi:hypothetical protein